MTELLMLAYDYVDLLKANENYQLYIKLNKEIKVKYQDEFEQLEQAKKTFEEVLEFGRFHPNFKEAAANYSKISRSLFSKPLLQQQLKINQKIELEVNNFLEKLVSVISPNIPILNELGFITSKGGLSCGC